MIKIVAKIKPRISNLEVLIERSNRNGCRTTNSMLFALSTEILKYKFLNDIKKNVSFDLNKAPGELSEEQVEDLRRAIKEVVNIEI